MQPEQKPPIIGRTTLKRLTATILFLTAAALFEYLVVLYAMRLGVQDASVLQWNFRFPGTDWPITIAISPAFQLVPVCVIATLAFSWTYLTKRSAVKRQEIRRGKVETFQKQRSEKKGLMSRISRTTKNVFKKVKLRLSRTRALSYLSRRIQPARTTIRNAVIVLLAFAAFTLLFSLLTYPQLIYRFVSNTYQSNPALFNFVISVDDWAKGVAGALGPIGWLSASINNALIATAPGVGYLGVGLGGLIGPIVTLDGMDKYLLFQNAASWISALIITIYGERTRVGYRYKK